jgi:hypothetical protein
MTINDLETRVVEMVACAPRLHIPAKRPQRSAQTNASSLPLPVAITVPTGGQQIAKPEGSGLN